MSIILKINLELAEEELISIGNALFDKTQEVEVVSKIEVDDMINYQQAEYYSILYIGTRDEDGEFIQDVLIYLIHKQYDFDKEILYGFYEIVESFGGEEIWNKFENISNTYNK